jgi:hypothetical protein
METGGSVIAASIPQILRFKTVTLQTAKNPEPIQQHDERKHHRQKNHREHTKQNSRITVIPPNLSLNTDVFHEQLEVDSRQWLGK